MLQALPLPQEVCPLLQKRDHLPAILRLLQPAVPKRAIGVWYPLVKSASQGKPARQSFAQQLAVKAELPGPDLGREPHPRAETIH